MPESTPPPKSPRHHLYVLALSVLVIVAAFCLQVLPDGDRVSLRGTAEAKLPPLCISRTYLGIKCPGCGLTRSFVYLAHGDVVASLRAHRLGWVLFALTLAQVPYRLGAMYSPAKARALATFGKWAAWVLVVLMLASWAGDLLFGRLT